MPSARNALHGSIRFLLLAGMATAAAHAQTPASPNQPSIEINLDALQAIAPPPAPVAPPPVYYPAQPASPYATQPISQSQQPYVAPQPTLPQRYAAPPTPPFQPSTAPQAVESRQVPLEQPSEVKKKKSKPKPKAVSKEERESVKVSSPPPLPKSMEPVQAFGLPTDAVEEVQPPSPSPPISKGKSKTVAVSPPVTPPSATVEEPLPIPPVIKPKPKTVTVSPPIAPKPVPEVQSLPEIPPIEPTTAPAPKEKVVKIAPEVPVAPPALPPVNAVPVSPPAPPPLPVLPISPVQTPPKLPEVLPPPVSPPPMPSAAHQSNVPDVSKLDFSKLPDPKLSAAPPPVAVAPKIIAPPPPAAKPAVVLVPETPAPPPIVKEPALPPSVTQRLDAMNLPPPPPALKDTKSIKNYAEPPVVTPPAAKPVAPFAPATQETGLPALTPIIGEKDPHARDSVAAPQDAVATTPIAAPAGAKSAPPPPLDLQLPALPGQKSAAKKPKAPPARPSEQAGVKITTDPTLPPVSRAVEPLPPAELPPAAAPSPLPAPVKELSKAEVKPSSLAPLPPLPDFPALKEQGQVLAPPQLPVVSAPKTESPAVPPAPITPVAEPAPVVASKPAPPPVVAPSLSPVSMGKTALSIAFPKDMSELSDDAKEQLAVLAEKAKQSQATVQVVGYASGNADQSSVAKRVSLSRALAVRAYLIDKGVNRLSIHVQSFGNKVPSGDPDRTDVSM